MHRQWHGALGICSSIKIHGLILEKMVKTLKVETKLHCLNFVFIQEKDKITHETNTHKNLGHNH